MSSSALLDKLFGAPAVLDAEAPEPTTRWLTFQVLEKTVAAEGELALGIFRHRANESGRHLQLNPPRKDYLELQPGDRLVVLCLT